MTRNVGVPERVVRIVVGVMFILLAAFNDLPYWESPVIYTLGLIAVVTGAVGFCPVWKLLGINTCPMPGVKH